MGRKPILEGGLFFCGVACILLTIGFYLEDDGSALSITFIIVGLFLFVTFYGFSLGTIVWLYIAEIVEPKMIPLTTAVNWLGSALITILFPIVTA